MDDIRRLINAAFDAPYTSNAYVLKLGVEALSALQYSLVRLGLAHTNVAPNCRMEVIAAITKYLTPALRPMPEDYMEDKVEQVAGAYFDQFRNASSTAEYHVAYVDILKAVADLVPSSAQATERSESEYVATGVAQDRVSSSAIARAQLVKASLGSMVLSETLAQGFPEPFLLEFKKRLAVWAGAAIESSRLEERSLRSVIFHVIKYVAQKRGYSSETLPTEVREALRKGLEHLEEAKSVAAVQAAYVKIIESLVTLTSTGVKGYRESDQRLFDLAGKFGRHCSQPNSPRGSGTAEFDYVLLRRGELADFVAALEKPVGGVVTTLPDQAALFDIAARCGRKEHFIHRTPGTRHERKVNCVVLEPAEVFRFAREMAKYQCAPASGEKDSQAELVSERELTLMREVLELRRQIDSLNAARIAYANEFPLTEDGEPDVGNIHANIRRLKSTTT